MGQFLRFHNKGCSPYLVKIGSSILMFFLKSKFNNCNYVSALRTSSVLLLNQLTDKLQIFETYLKFLDISSLWDTVSIRVFSKHLFMAIRKRARIRFQWYILGKVHSQVWDTLWLPRALWKWWKVIFISPQKLFSFSRFLTFSIDFLVV